MTEVLQANIFFFITSVAVVVVTVLIAFILFYVLGIVRNVKDISDKIKKSSDIISDDFMALRNVVREEGAKTKNIIDFFIGRIVPKRKRATRKRKEDINN